MFKSLHNRLIFSHMLPLLVILPLAWAALVYVLEVRVFLPNLSQELAGDTALLGEILRQEPGWWQDPALTRQVLLAANPRLGKRVMLIDPDGRLLASSDPADADRLDQPLALAALQNPPTSDLLVTTNYSQRLQSEVVDVLAPVAGQDGGRLGYVRVTSRYTTLSEQLLQQRNLIGLVMIAGLGLGAVLGSLLAVSIGRPVQQITGAVIQLTHGNWKDTLVETGPEEIRLLAQAVNALVARLRSLEESRRRLLANLVHELGRPLGSLRMAVQVLLQGSKEDPGQLNELLTGMDLEMEGLQRLLNELAHLHDQVLGTLELDRQPLSLSQWLPTVLRPWEAIARQKGLRWEQELPAGLEPVPADPARLGQVVGNLLSNAIKFTPPAGQVRVSAGLDPDRAWIRVQDTGPGISPADQERIFVPFFQAQSGVRIRAGMGLGLSIARDLVEAHQGSIEVESQPGQGSRFTVYLPRS